jgi:small subunit ribosomal protein S18
MANMKARAASVAEKSMADLELQRDQQLSKDYLKQMPRSWAAGDVYSPRDLSPYQMGKFRTRARRTGDVIDALGINPVDHYTNFSIISDFTTASAMIKHSAETNLRPANQRKIAKMIRRAQGLGLYPTIHKHPEMLREDFFPTDK